MGAELHVICLCAQWCGTCREWHPVMDDIARTLPHVRWRWLDIEDEDALLSDLDVETLPTLLVGRGDQVLFYGPVLPKIDLLTRLIDTLSQQTHGASGIDPQALALWQRLRDAA